MNTLSEDIAIGLAQDYLRFIRFGMITKGIELTEAERDEDAAAIAKLQDQQQVLKNIAISMQMFLEHIKDPKEEFLKVMNLMDSQSEVVDIYNKVYEEEIKNGI